MKAQGKKKKWDEQYMDQAVELVKKDGVPIRTSARIMGVPRWTLRNRIENGNYRKTKKRCFYNEYSMLNPRQNSVNS